MALDETYQAHAFNQALGYVARERAADRARGRPNAGIGVSAITRALYNNNLNVPGANYSSYAAVVRRAVAAESLAREMNENPARAPPLRELPVVPTLQADTGRFRYYVAVSYEGANGTVGTTRAEVVSDSPLSGQQVEDRVRERIDTTESRGRSSRSALRRVGSGAEIATVTIIAATRIR